MTTRFRISYFSIPLAFAMLVFALRDASPTDVNAASSPKMLVHNAGITASSLPFNGWLAFKVPADYAKTADTASELDLPSTPDGSFTIEASFELSKTIHNFYYGFGVVPIIEKRGAYGLSIKEQCSISFPPTCSRYVTYENGTGGVVYSWGVAYPTAFLADRWYHIALVYDGGAKKARLYFDGNLLASGSETYTIATAGNLAIGYFTPSIGSNLMQSVDEVRISNSIRYTDSFTLATAPFICDAYTRALWHFDELEGSTTFHDACGTEDNFLTGVNDAHTEGVPGYWVYLPLVVK